MSVATSCKNTRRNLHRHTRRIYSRHTHIRYSSTTTALLGTCLFCEMPNTKCTLILNINMNNSLEQTRECCFVVFWLSFSLCARALTVCSVHGGDRQMESSANRKNNIIIEMLFFDFSLLFLEGSRRTPRNNVQWQYAVRPRQFGQEFETKWQTRALQFVTKPEFAFSCTLHFCWWCWMLFVCGCWFQGTGVKVEGLTYVRDFHRRHSLGIRAANMGEEMRIIIGRVWRSNDCCCCCWSIRCWESQVRASWFGVELFNCSFQSPSWWVVSGSLCVCTEGLPVRDLMLWS